MLSEQDMRAIGKKWRSYDLYGLTLVTDFPFARRLASGSADSDLAFTCVTASPLPGALTREKPIYASPSDNEDHESDFHLYSLEACLVLSWSPYLDFYLWPNRIVCHVRDPERYRFVEMLLLNVVFACWLEWRGVPTLHASAVVVDDRAVAFVAMPGSGESSIVAALMQAGHPLLTDGLLPVEYSGGEYLGRPSYPQVLMWPDLAYHVMGRYEGPDLVLPNNTMRRIPVGEDGGFGFFCDEPRPLGCIYLPERRNPVDWGTHVRIKPVPPRDELMTLIGYSFVVGIVEALGMHALRLGFFSDMVSRVPMRRIIYPSGPEFLPRVRQAVLKDLESLAPSKRGS